ncbi:endo-1,4-beta-xylanase [Gracilibacillus marinus]|uniref:Beta-xylanase n=1 Tax=Gracilibacillus marinus TaxID=630535 RepID=A0ABV8VWB0_9BACI
MSKEIPSLYKQFEDAFKIGAAINKYTLQTSQETIKKHYNSITAENEMKFENLHPKEDVYNFEISDQMIQFAQNNQIAMRGHTLVWHNQTSNWLFEHNGRQVDKETLISRMEEHIATVVGRYKGKIYSWDVVNEVIADEKNTFYRDSKWYEILGETFIDKAFQFAHHADPTAKLFYNDYNESDPIKSEKIYQLVKRLKENDVPIHGVGMQAHWNIYDPSLDKIKAAIEKYASLGMEIQLTELDVSMFAFDDKRTDLAHPTEEMLALQATRYEHVFDLLRQYKEHITAVTFWGVADDYTWLNNFPVRERKNWPFLLDEKHQPKQAFWNVVK